MEEKMTSYFGRNGLHDLHDNFHNFHIVTRNHASHKKPLEEDKKINNSCLDTKIKYRNKNRRKSKFFRAKGI